MRWRRRLQLAAFIVFLAAYAGLSHYSNTTAKARDLGIGLALAPMLTLGLLLLWRCGRVWAVLPAAAAAAALLQHFWPLLKANFPVLYLLQEGGFYSIMAASFGQSLFGHRVALCTQIADKLHGPLSAEELLYTRRVTAAWALFFMLIIAANVGLCFFAPLRIWSLFANFCVVALIGLMFVAEYAVRRVVLPRMPHQRLLAAVKVYFASSP